MITMAALPSRGQAFYLTLVLAWPYRAIEGHFGKRFPNLGDEGRRCDALFRGRYIDIGVWRSHRSEDSS